MKSLYYCFLFLFSFLFVDILVINSHDHLRLIYDKNNVIDAEVYEVYFKNLSFYEIKNLLDEINVELLAIKPYEMSDIKARGYNTNTILSNFIDDYNKEVIGEERKLYNTIKGFKIEKMNIKCNVSELIKLERIMDIY